MTSSDSISNPQPKRIGPIGAIRSGFARYFDFAGRSSRPEFWWWAIAVWCIGFVASWVDRALSLTVFGLVPTFGIVANPEGVEFTFQTSGGLLASLTFLAVIIPTVAVGFRRCRDAGVPAWLFLLPIVAFVGLFLLVLVAFGIGADMSSPSIGWIIMIAFLGSILTRLFILVSKSNPASGPSEMVQS